MFLKLLEKNLEFNNYRSKSIPPNIGEPMKNAKVITTPKTIPAITSRLFIAKINYRRIKSNCRKTRFGISL